MSKYRIPVTSFLKRKWSLSKACQEGYSVVRVSLKINYQINGSSSASVLLLPTRIKTHQFYKHWKPILILCSVIPLNNHKFVRDMFSVLSCLGPVESGSVHWFCQIFCSILSPSPGAVAHVTTCLFSKNVKVYNYFSNSFERMNVGCNDRDGPYYQIFFSCFCLD